MPRIKVLPDNLANQIAAGEVVERPASVVKELVENAIDAGSRRIQVDIELGGRRLIRVTDDGTGMSRDDALLSFERHATSKIGTLEDLGRISTLGFRGEALASIASVARVEMVTRNEQDETATRVANEGGRISDVRDAARPRGTTVTVRDLFFNTPARRKFMRSEATENYHLTAIVTHYALANPELAFTLTNNGRETLRLAPARDLRERAFQIFGRNVLESLLPVAGGTEFIARVSGFVSAPRERRTSRDQQYFFINGRYVRDRIVAGGLSEGYRSVLPHGSYPVAFLFLDIPFEEIDVNVHPAKTEVRFRRAEAVRETIAAAVRLALGSGGVAPQRPQPVAEPFPETAPDAADIRERGAAALPFWTPPVPATAGRDEIIGWLNESAPVTRTESSRPDFVTEPVEPSASADLGSRSEAPFPFDSAARLVSTAEVSGIDPRRLKVIGQMHESFIIATDEQGLLLIDQHVAHERILFDKFRHREGARAPAVQKLLIPETFDLSPAQAAAYEAVAADLAECGFETMRLSGRTVAVKAVPADVPASEARNLLAEMLDAVEPESRGGARLSLRDEIAAALACRAAVKINTSLTIEKMSWLVDGLFHTSSPSTCPHGRPVVLRLTMRDIERGFHRS